jgi:hypothetical protein
MDMGGGIDEARISVATRWTETFSVNTQEYPGAGGSTPYELASMPWTEEQVSTLKWAGVGDILYVVHPEVAVYKISRTGHDVWTCNIVDWDGPPWKDVNDGATTLTSAVFSVGTARDLVASAALFTSSHGLLLTGICRHGVLLMVTLHALLSLRIGSAYPVLTVNRQKFVSVKQAIMKT